jgi:hypothetical protein
LAITVLFLTTPRLADAQERERLRAEVSSQEMAEVMGSSLAHMTSLFWQRTPHLVCDPSTNQGCSATTFLAADLVPRFRLHWDLPSNFSLHVHSWAAPNAGPYRTRARYMAGGTVRRTVSLSWYELGFGLAKREDPESAGNLGLGLETGGFTPALLAGVGRRLNIGNRVWLNLSLRGGVDAGEMPPEVYHADFVIGIMRVGPAWRRHHLPDNSLP